MKDIVADIHGEDDIHIFILKFVTDGLGRRPFVCHTTTKVVCDFYQKLLREFKKKHKMTQVLVYSEKGKKLVEINCPGIVSET